MQKFIAIKYHKKIYPPNIPTLIEEVACHFDIGKVDVTGRYSLHTEYSYTGRKLNQQVLQKYDEILSANKNGVPQLWNNIRWAKQFADYILEVTSDILPPDIIEIHPPFNDCIKDLDSFIEIYKTFEFMVLSKYPSTKIMIENRCGSLYRGGRFLISRVDELAELSRKIEQNNLSLGITLDIPQLFTAHIKSNESKSKISELLGNVKSFRESILGVHLWGKRKSEKGINIAHVGDLNSYFNFNEDLKRHFLCELASVFDDNMIRAMVLEVNSSNEDLLSIINDLKKYNFVFL